MKIGLQAAPDLNCIEKAFLHIHKDVPYTGSLASVCLCHSTVASLDMIRWAYVAFLPKTGLETLRGKRSI